MLGDTQWAWLQAEFNTPSEVKIIGSGIQVLPPLADEGRVSKSSYCAYDGAGGTFDAAIAEMAEVGKRGSEYEQWAEIPQERTKLLRMAQKSINDGHTRAVIFVSGDQHWGELSRKEIPASSTHGAAATVYELTASGLDANWFSSTIQFYNDNRATDVPTCDTQNNGHMANTCVFPFIYEGVTYNECTMEDLNVPWCYHQVDAQGVGVSGQWGVCGSFVNNAPSNYGEIAFDWANSQVALRVITPDMTPRVSGELVVSLAPPGAPTPPPTPPPSPAPVVAPTYNEAPDCGTGAAYRGTHATTISGKTCQQWTAQTPHSHSRTPANYPSGGLGDHNYCRNPDGEPQAWCYTTDPNSRWEYCDVCTFGAVDESPDCGTGAQYRGSLSTTVDGYTCMPWTDQSPHSHSRTPANYPNAGLGDHNYCRNPDGENQAWCYTTDPNKRWDWCDCCEFCTPTEDLYRGTVSTTASGKTCQEWTQQSPHSHKRTPANYPNGGLGDHNYCRNPDGEPEGSWCYTTDSGTRWEYCNVC
eukprot:m.59035 g.59035  ORF g.59035 m.59035 type:complete len:527 (+) comp9439_c0_seq1:618-2198(+)